jgi:hypothetical protein
MALKRRATAYSTATLPLARCPLFAEKQMLRQGCQTSQFDPILTSDHLATMASPYLWRPWPKHLAVGVVF